MKEKQNDRTTTSIASDGLTMEAPARNFRFRLDLELGDKKYNVDKSFMIGSTTSKYMDMISDRKSKMLEMMSEKLRVIERTDAAKNFVGVSRNVITHPVNTTVAVAKVYKDYVKSIVMRPASYMAEKVLSFSERANEKVKEAAERVAKKSEEVKQDLRNSETEYANEMGISNGYAHSKRHSDYDISKSGQYVGGNVDAMKVAGQYAGGNVGAMKVAGQSNKPFAQSNIKSEDIESVELNYHPDIEGPRMSIHNGVSVATFRLNRNMVTGARGEKFIEPVPSPNRGDVEKSLSLVMYNKDGRTKQYANIPGLVGFSKKDDGKTYIAIRTESIPIGNGKYHGGVTLSWIQLTLKQFNEGVQNYWNDINMKRNAAKPAKVINQENRQANRDRSKGMQ